MVDPYSTARSYFANHSFLIWTPGDVRPELYEDQAEKTKLPLSANSEALVIDACAGPYVGDLRRGLWEQPWDIKDGKGETYSGKRDTVTSKDFDEKRFHVFQELHHVDGWLAATSESLTLHVDMTGPKVAHFPDDILANFK